jgi:hypothetical protein
VIFKEALGVALIIVPSSQLASRSGRKKLASRNSVGYLTVCVIKNYGAASARALASDTSATVGWESNQTSALRFKVREQMLQACCEQCCEKVACNIQTSVGLLPPPSCCDHVATILRPCCNSCCVQHPTSGAFPPPPQHKNQHHMSATLKLNIRNIKFNICNTQQYASATSKLGICNVEINVCSIEKFISIFETFA